MTPDVLDSRPVVRCQGTADFLAALPHLTGFTATDSIFIVCFDGSRSGQAVRADLPARDSPSDTLALLDFISGLSRDISTARGTRCALAIVIATSERFADSPYSPPQQRLARRIERRLRRERVPVQELCVLAADAWVSFFDSRAPREGRPLSEIAESPVTHEARSHGAEPSDLAHLGIIPEPDPDLADAVGAALDRVLPHDFPVSTGVPPHLPETGNLTEYALEWMTETSAVTRWLLESAEFDADADAVARLIRATAHPGRWFVLALGLITRPEFPVELGREHPLGNFIGIPIELDVDLGIAPASRPQPSAASAAGWVGRCAHGEPDSDGVCRRALHAPPPGWSVYRLLASICPEFTAHERLPELRARLREAISLTPEALRPGLLGLSAWVWWLSGTQSVAQRQLDAAQAIDPDDPLLRMLRRLTDQPLYARFVAGAAGGPTTPLVEPEAA